MRALITGSGGFVGKYLAQHLVDSGDEVLGTDVLAPGPVVAIESPRFSLVKMDICDIDHCSRVIGEFRPEVIYHLAGIAFVPEAENNFDTALLVNVGGTNNIARTCHLLQLGTTILYVSSAEVYGRILPAELPVDEKVPLRPANNYSLSKLMGEMVMQRYEQFGYIRSVIMRPFNHIGAGQDERFVVSSFAKQLAQIARGTHPPVLRVGNLEAQRDFSDVQDIVWGYRLAAAKGQGIYNLCAGQGTSIRLILDTLIEISGVKVTIEKDHSRMRASEVPVVYGSYQRAFKDLGWEPKASLKESLKEVYEYWFKRTGT